VLFAPIFATVVWWAEPGWNRVLGLTMLVLCFAFIAVWRVVAGTGALTGWWLYWWAARSG
jgi:hypothetical protein